LIDFIALVHLANLTSSTEHTYFCLIELFFSGVMAD